MSRKKKYRNNKKKESPAPAVNAGARLLKPERESGLELLRIFAMLMIIAHHFAYYGGPNALTPADAPNCYITQLLMPGGALGVNLFFMLSGYFASEGTFRLKRLLKIDFTAIFYCTVMICVMTFVMKQKYDTYTWLKAFMPITLDNYWFLMVYAAIFFLSPFFKKLINSITAAQFTAIAVIMLVFESVLPTLNFKANMANFKAPFMIGINAYFLGAYLKKCPPAFLRTKTKSLIAAIMTFTVLGLVGIYSFKYEKTNNIWKMYRSMVFWHGNLITVLCSASIFMFFANLRLGCVKWINFISQAMLGVYILHECPVSRGHLWGKILKSSSVIHSEYFIFQSMRIVFTVLIGCTVIELLRLYFIEKPLFKLSIFDSLCGKADKFMNSISEE